MRLALLLALLAPSARAQLVLQENGPYRSPQHFAFELKFGPYSPDIDSTPGLTGKPFSELFTAQDGPEVGKRPSGRLLSTIEVDWQIWHGFGSIGLAGSVGIMRRTTHSFQFDGGASCKVPDCARSSDTTSLNVMPFTLEAVYRFDVLTKRNIPVVPYLKGGIAWYLWWMENGSGGLSASIQDPNDKAIGATLGLVAHPGVALLLDILEPSAARTMDAELGINHSYLFFEGHLAWITGLGMPNKIVLSDMTWNAGIAFEF